MTALGSYQLVAALVVVATSAAYFFNQLYHARMLVIDKQRKGLVSQSPSSTNLRPLMIASQ